MDRINTFIDRNEPALIGRLKRLVEFPTVNPPGVDYGEITAYLTRELGKIGLSAKRYTVPLKMMKEILPEDQLGYPRYNVIGKLKVPGAKKTIHFNAHFDVVPVSGTWRHGNPFSGAVEKGLIYGRGTADMKGSIASLLTALHALVQTGSKPKMNIEVSFTADEETDSYLGSRWVVKEAPIKPDYAIVMEGGEGDEVCCGHNGNLWFEVTVHGRAAHGSTPQEGINALEKMSALIAELQTYKKQIAKTKFLTPEGKTMQPTINLGGVFSSGEGGKINTVPALAKFSIDRRVIATEDQATAEKGLRTFLVEAAKRIPDCKISITKVSENFSSFTKPTHKFFKAVASSVGKVRRKPTAFHVSAGFNDIHYFSHELKIPTLGYGPGGDDCHAVDEKARVQDLVNTAKIYADLLTTFEG